MSETFLILSPKNDQAIHDNVFVKISNHEDVNFNNFNVQMANSFSHLIHAYRENLTDLVVERGISNLINQETLDEALVPINAPQNQILNFFKKYLNRLGIDRELIIIDPYFLSPRRGNNNHEREYTQLFKELLVDYIQNISKIIIITTSIQRHIDENLLHSITSSLNELNNNLEIIHRTSDNFHDRFWISNNRGSGIVTGTSLNGFGNKYSLIDRLNVTDVREIISFLNNEQLI
ncbi:hypothetical protein [Flectobacillus sp. BAB-3569]|uniref:hypothetical protein n=1 Tax=Flectobacillus sp. BAB-3569 TaxID=1509483 RepID=UPI000BA40AB6|nr:hypothetical protein [Flectobacillus sp. BAB-3569]PAC29262.1 hypothetical protein BWI92_16670 [Flectobacillus sp. BAB-3569]